MKVKRERRGLGWAADERRGLWYVVDRRTGRRVRVHDRGDAVRTAAANNERELCGAACVPAAVVWGKV
jgi:glucose dehydrogenase